MAVGLGARKNNMDAKFFSSAAVNPDNYVSGGVVSGKTVVPFPVGYGGAEDGATNLNLDATSLLVWAITVGAIAVVLGIHASFGGTKLF